jgi:hypothetical protein
MITNKESILYLYEVISAHLSNALLSPDEMNVYKILNIQVKVNFEAQQDLRAVGPSNEDVANEFAASMKELFLNNLLILGPDNENAKKVTIDIKESEDKSKFGWFELYNKNAN